MNRRNLLKNLGLAGLVYQFPNPLFSQTNKIIGGEKVKLNNGIEIPILGYGTYQVSSNIAEQCVLDALEVGYRHIDTAKYYRNEREVGLAVKNSGLKRTELFITTKLYSTSYDEAMRDIEDSVNKIGDFVDLMLIHWVVSNDTKTYKAIEDAIKQGMVKSVGISNYYGSDLKRILNNAKILPVLNQVECNIIQQQKDLQKELAKNNIFVEAWSPFGGGSHSREVLANPIIGEIAKSYNKTPAQIILRWFVQRNIIVIPKTSKKERMKENFSIWDFELKNEDMNKIANLDTKKGYFSWY